MWLLFLTCSEIHGGCGSTKPGVTGETRKNQVTWMPRWSNDFIKEKLQTQVPNTNLWQVNAYALCLCCSSEQRRDTIFRTKGTEENKLLSMASRHQGGSHLLPIQQVWSFYAAAELFTPRRRGTVYCPLFHRDETMEKEAPLVRGTFLSRGCLAWQDEMQSTVGQKLKSRCICFCDFYFWSVEDRLCFLKHLIHWK